MLLRLLVIFAILYVIWSVLKANLRTRPTSTRKPATTEGEEMVLDPQCQSYVPRADAILQAGKYFCSQECARLYLTR